MAGLPHARIVDLPKVDPWMAAVNVRFGQPAERCPPNASSTKGWLMAGPWCATTVGDPDAVLAEVRRILKPGGRFSFAEHVVARGGTPTRLAQRVLRRPWAWVFEGCSCERDLASAVRSAGFSSVDLSPYRIRTPLLPFNTHIAGTAIA